MATATIKLGKIAYSGTGKVNEVEVELTLEGTPERPTFTCSGWIWNATHTDLISGGQNLDTIAVFIDTPLFRDIRRLWKKYHLNDMHVGTEKQEAFLEGYFFGSGGKWDFVTACNVLKEKNLYCDRGYRYGSGWQYVPIPDNDLCLIKEIIKAYEDK